MTTKVCLLLGGLFGIDAGLTSGGMLVLKDRLAPLPVTVEDWNDYQNLPLPGANKLAIIGYSGGGSRATWWACWRHTVPIDLLVLYDPSPSWQMMPLTPNVKKVITYENTSPMMPSIFGMLGGGVVTLAPGNKTTDIKRVMIHEQHLFVQGNTKLHDETVEAVKALG